MSQQTRTVEQREHHAVRASHAKSSGLLVGELSIPSLPPELAQGLFATAGTHPVAIRLAQGPGETLGDRVGTHRGMSLKIFGVPGDKLPGHTADTQDFVLASGPTFPGGTAGGFLKQAQKIGPVTGAPELVKSTASALARNFNRVLHAVGLDSPTADFYGHPFGHPLAEPYYSQAPIRFGAHVAKLAAFPTGPAQQALLDWRLDPKGDEDGFRHATIEYFQTNDATYELRAQLWTDRDAQPIEDTSVEWDAKASPYRTVATLRIPAQDAYSPARQRMFDEQMTFRPAHSLVEHRPLGSVMRARLQVYQALSDLRHRENGIPAANPARIEDIPA